MVSAATQWWHAIQFRAQFCRTNAICSLEEVVHFMRSLQEFYETHRSSIREILPLEVSMQCENNYKATNVENNATVKLTVSK